MATANKKQIKPLVSVIPIESKDVETFWPLAEFMVSEALAFSGKWADSSYFYDELKANTMQLSLMFQCKTFCVLLAYLTLSLIKEINIFILLSCILMRLFQIIIDKTWISLASIVGKTLRDIHS